MNNTSIYQEVWSEEGEEEGVACVPGGLAVEGNARAEVVLSEETSTEEDNGEERR